MQRIRMSLPYFKNFGWEAEIVTVDSQYADIVKDPLLLETIPTDIKVHFVKAFSKKWTSKIGIGSISLRSLYFYKNRVSALLKKEKFDLIYFSTTQFPVTILGNYWKIRFNIPYVIDMQDPWHSNYYNDKPKAERPKKFWFSYQMNKYLEPIAMKNVDGLISVSRDYLITLKNRYQELKNIPAAVITFGAFDQDLRIAKSNKSKFKNVIKDITEINIVYVGRGGHDMAKSLTILFQAFKESLIVNPSIYQKIHFYFVGTSYAKNGEGIKTILPVAKKLEIGNFVTEITDRLPYFEALHLIQIADGLIVTGSDNVAYNASKLYPYISAKKLLLGIFHKESDSAKTIIDCNAGDLITLTDTTEKIMATFDSFLTKIIKKESSNTNWDEFEKYTAEALTKKQVALFDEVIENLKESI